MSGMTEKTAQYRSAYLSNFTWITQTITNHHY